MSSASASTPRRSVALAGAVLALTLAFTLFRAPATSGPYERDFEAYYAAGATWNAGGDPWSRALWPVERAVPGVDAAHEDLLPYVGPAAALPLFGALARLGWPIAERIWEGIIAGALGILVVATLVLARVCRVQALLAGTAFALASGAGTSDLALGQAALVTAAAVATALVFSERRAVVGGTVATLAAGMQPNLALGLVGRLRDRSAWLCASAGAALFFALTLTVGGGLAGFGAYLSRLAAHGAAERFVSIQHTPAAVAWAFGASESVARSVGLALALAAIALVAGATLRGPLDSRDGALLALTALPFAVPFFHEHDFVIELIPALVLALRATRAARAWAALGTLCVLVDWFGLAQRPEANGQILAEALAVALAFIALGPPGRMRRTELAPLVTLLALGAFALPLARAHAAPTWPDGLPAGYRAPVNADASAVWADEQRSAGLERREPAWGALRAIPLAGCAALGIAIVLNASCRRSDPKAQCEAEPLEA